jgi:hypothetical protein
MPSVLSHVDWLAVLVAGLAYFILGMIWYSMLFGKAWIRLTGVNANDPNMKKGAAGIFLTSLIMMLVASFGMGVLLAYFQPHNIMLGVKLGLLVGVCFSATAISISYLYEKKPFGLHLINGGYNVVGCVVVGVVQCLL